MSAIDFLRDVGKHFRVGTMLAKDIVARRLNSDEGISFTEFSYQMLQGMDFRELYRRHGCTLQTGGSDQWGNRAGVELIRKVRGRRRARPDDAADHQGRRHQVRQVRGRRHLARPRDDQPVRLLPVLAQPGDADVGNYLKVFTFRGREEIAELEREVAERPFAREAQKALAGDVTTLVHGAGRPRRHHGEPGPVRPR